MEQILQTILNEIKDVKKGQDRLESRMESLESRMGNMESRMEIIENRMETMENRMETMENRMGIMEDRMVTIETRMVNLEENQQKFEDQLSQYASEFRSSFTFTNEKIDEHHRVFDVVSDQMKNMKIDVEYLSSKLGMQDVQLNQVITRLNH